ncbi:UNVERIFIED_CONTAM: hypothetical protein FKN15_004650 [Acipenser sinensis]
MKCLREKGQGPRIDQYFLRSQSSQSNEIQRQEANHSSQDISTPVIDVRRTCMDTVSDEPNDPCEPDPIESHAIPESEAQERPKIEAVYTQEESFEQEWCASLIQVTELPCVKDEDVPEQECFPIKEEFMEQECVPIAEELPTENNVCTLEENTKLGSNLCDDSPSECDLGFGSFKVDEGEHDSTPSPECKNSSRGKPQCKKHRETTPQEDLLQWVLWKLPRYHGESAVPQDTAQCIITVMFVGRDSAG